MAASASDAHPYPIYNARYRVLFPILDADGDLVTGAASLDSELSQDCGTFADATNEATEIATSSGMYYLDLIATELDTKSTAVIVKTGTSGAKTTPMVLYPKRLPVVRTGTAQAGAASTITLDSGASGVDDFYNGCFVNITNNSPANALGQCRKIVDYVGSTKVATVEGAYGTNPSSASTFEILLTEEASSMVAIAGTAVVDPTTAGRLNVNTTHVSNTSQTAGDIPALVTTVDTVVDSILVDTAEIGAAGAGLTNINLPDQTMNITGNITGNLSGSVGSVTGAVGSVTGNVGGSVASVTAGVTLANDAITAAAIATSGGEEIADAVWDEARAGHVAAGSFGEGVASVQGNVTGNVAGSVGSVTGAVGSVTGAVGSVTGNVGGNVTGSVGSVAAGGIAAASFAAGAIDASAIAANAIGASELAADAVAEIADAVWDEAIAGHAGAGSTGAALSAAGSAGDPWSTALPGAYGAGTAGKIIGDNIDAAISTRLATSGYTAPLDAAGTRTAVGLASANLDTQLDALPTAVENADALLGRNVAGGADGTRTVSQALYVLRNKTAIAGGTLTVYGTDDTTAAFTATVGTTAGDPISSIDPA